MINLKQLYHRCNASIPSFHELGLAQDGYIYLDRGADVLAVGHLDTVLHSKLFRLQSKKSNGKGKVQSVQSPNLDDRLGVHIILDVLPKLGIITDVLLTTGEEACQSTARLFQNPRRYNWAIEFDRAGTDVVLYQYESQETIEAVESVGLRVGIGSYSDIAELKDCVGFNFGTGYYQAHTKHCYCVLADAKMMIQKFVQFYAKYKDTRFDIPPVLEWECWDDWDEVTPSFITCDGCGDIYHKAELQTTMQGWLLCPICAVWFENQI